MRRPRNAGWYATFILLVVVAFVVIYFLTGRDALGATARFLWSAVVVAFEGIMSAAGATLELLGRTLAWGRLRNLSRAITGIGLGYAAGVLLSDKSLHRARGWRHKLIAAIAALHDRWNRLPFWVKIVLVIALIASQIYLGWLLILFPIAFMVPVVRQVGVNIADSVLSKWYLKAFGKRRRALFSRMRKWPVIRSVVGAARLLRIRYLCAWRLWHYDPRYQVSQTHARRRSIIEPFRLWRRGALDAYIGRPLLAGPRAPGREVAGGGREGASRAHQTS